MCTSVHALCLVLNHGIGDTVSPTYLIMLNTDSLVSLHVTVSCLYAAELRVPTDDQVAVLLYIGMQASKLSLITTLLTKDAVTQLSAGVVYWGEAQSSVLQVRQVSFCSM